MLAAMVIHSGPELTLLHDCFAVGLLVIPDQRLSMAHIASLNKWVRTTVQMRCVAWSVPRPSSIKPAYLG
jgi:hypothetical protein